MPDLELETAMRPRSWKRGHGFLCFGAAAAEEDEVEESSRGSVGSSGRGEEALQDGPRPRRLRLQSRVLAKFFRSVSFLICPNRNGKERKDSSRLSDSSKTASESSAKSRDGDDNHRSAAAVFSSASSSSSPFFSSSSSSSSYSSSSSSSSASSASISRLSSAVTSGFPDPPEQKEHQKRSPLTLCSSATRAFLLVTGLAMTVFCGRLSAIMWTSSWLCLIARRFSKRETAAVKEIIEAAPAEVVLKVAAAKLRRERGEEREQKKKVLFLCLWRRNRKA
ncbi:unnamed protein product [Musa acuminata subsp. burmannicoides]